MVKNQFKNSSSLIRIRIFIQIRPQLFEISCTQRQTDRQTVRGEDITSFTFGGGGNKDKKVSTGGTRILKLKTNLGIEKSKSKANKYKGID